MDIETCEFDKNLISSKIYSKINSCVKEKPLPQKEQKVGYYMLPKLFVKSDYIKYIKSINLLKLDNNKELLMKILCLFLDEYYKLIKSDFSNYKWRDVKKYIGEKITSNLQLTYTNINTQFLCILSDFEENNKDNFKVFYI